MTLCISTFHNPLVSVIIPTYNRGWILRDAIDSVLAQTYTNFELIVVDDGSTDDTQEVLDSYAGQLISIHQRNQGVSSARNTGLSRSTGELIAFLDSDDLWLSDKLSHQVAFFNDQPDALICQTEETWIRNGQRVNPKLRHRKASGPIFDRSLMLCLVSPSAVMVRRQLFEIVGKFDEKLPACEDYDLWLRVSCRMPVYLIDVPLIIKRGGHADQLSRQPSLDQFRISSLNRLIETEPLSTHQRSGAVRVLMEKCDIYANGCQKRGKDHEAIYYRKLAESYRNSVCQTPTS